MHAWLHVRYATAASLQVPVSLPVRLSVSLSVCVRSAERGGGSLLLGQLSRSARRLRSQVGRSPSVVL